MEIDLAVTDFERDEGIQSRQQKRVWYLYLSAGDIDRDVAVAEDVVTKGGRVQQTIDLARSFGADIVGIAVIVDRSGGDAKFDVPFKSALKLSLPTFQPEECPLCKEGLPVDRPGSK